MSRGSVLSQGRPTNEAFAFDGARQKDETPRDSEGFLGAPGAIRTPDPQIRRLASPSCEESESAKSAEACGQPVGTDTSDGSEAQRARGVCPTVVPRNPTRGWMFSELDRHGVHVRGQKLTDAQLVALLARAGVVVGAGSEQPAPTTQDDR